jgi:hypothetical protein
VDERDWREVLGRAINDGKPPSYWRDHDVDALHARLESVAEDFVRIESLVAKLGETTTKVVSFAILDAAEGESRAEIACVDSVSERAQNLIKSIEKVLPQSDDDPMATLVALAEVAVRIQQQHSSQKDDGGTE